MAQERLAELLPSRLNPTRINSCIHDTNPERQLLMGLAGGMEVDLPVGFVPNGGAPETRSTLRKMYVKTRLAVDCRFYAIYTQGLTFLLKTSTALKVKGVHSSPLLLRTVIELIVLLLRTVTGLIVPLLRTVIVLIALLLRTLTVLIALILRTVVVLRVLLLRTVIVLIAVYP